MMIIISQQGGISLIGKVKLPVSDLCDSLDCFMACKWIDALTTMVLINWAKNYRIKRMLISKAACGHLQTK